MSAWEEVQAHVHRLGDQLHAIDASLRKVTPETIRQIVREEIRDGLAALHAAVEQAEEPPQALVDVLHSQSAEHKAARKRTKPSGGEST